MALSPFAASSATTGTDVTKAGLVGGAVVVLLCAADDRVVSIDDGCITCS